MKNSKIEKILGVTFNNKLNFNGHKSIGKKKSSKRSIHKLATRNSVIATNNQLFSTSCVMTK